jgi:uncharacterized protein
VKHRWFLPETPDVLGQLRAQLAVTIEGMDAFVAWAGGDAAAEAAVRDCEHRADEAKRLLFRTLSDAFVTPLEPEDLFALSRAIDRVINEAKDTVRESELMACPPDAAVAAMAEDLAGAMRALDAAVDGLQRAHRDPSAHADAAVKAARRLERVYRSAMAELLEVDDLPTVMARRELYRRGSRIGDAVVDAAERILYAVVKEA